eukprot:scaffold61763_cov61-Phaeocystis_antarctica.AAC.3
MPLGNLAELQPRADSTARRECTCAVECGKLEGSQELTAHRDAFGKASASRPCALLLLLTPPRLHACLELSCEHAPPLALLPRRRRRRARRAVRRTQCSTRRRRARLDLPGLGIGALSAARPVVPPLLKRRLLAARHARRTRRTTSAR